MVLGGSESKKEDAGSSAIEAIAQHGSKTWMKPMKETNVPNEDAADEVEITITISKKAYDKAKVAAKDHEGPAGDWAEFLSTEEYIERIIEMHFED